MRNSFNVEVCFSKVPLQPYEWNNISFISGIKVLRVSTKCISDLLLYESKISIDNKLMLLSDTNTSIVVRLDDSGKVIKRSFLKYSKDTEIMEFACNLKTTKLDYFITKEKLEYNYDLIEDIKIREYLVHSINKIKDEGMSKYLYYLCFDDIKDYSKEKLLESIKNDSEGKNIELYNFLIKS